MSRGTRFICSLIKTSVLLGPIALAAPLAAPALAATTDPLQVLYVFPGATDNGGATDAGVATSVHCYSFSGTTETIQVVARNFDSTVKANMSTTIDFLNTITISTHLTLLYAEDVSLSTGVINQGIIGILATSPNMVCTAQVIDASATVPNGIDLHGLRVNPFTGSQE